MKNLGEILKELESLRNLKLDFRYNDLGQNRENFKYLGQGLKQLKNLE